MVVLLALSAAEMGVVMPCSSPMTVEVSITLWSCPRLGCLAASIFRSCLTPLQSVCEVLEAPEADGWKETMDR